MSKNYLPYTIDFLNNRQNLHLFGDLYNKFFTTWHEDLKYKTFDGRVDDYLWTTIPPEYLKEKNVIDDKSIKYLYNLDFFRSDNFKKDHDKKHILFSGCSETEGVGGNLEDAWSYMLYNKIKEDEKLSGFFNLGKSGFGYQRIISTLLIYFEKYGTPEYLFILLPNCQRYTKFINDRFTYVQQYPDYYLSSHKDDQIEFTSRETYLTNFIDFIYHWTLFNEFCKLKNIKMFFSCWDYLDSININNSKKFDNFLYYNQKDVDSFIYNYMIKLNNSEINITNLHSKRDGHRGVLMHEFWSDLFYKKYLLDKNV